MIINGKELEIRFYEEKSARKYEKAMKRLSQDAKKAAEAKGNTEAIRSLCFAIRSCFDYLFTPGTSNQIFGDRMDLEEHLDALNTLQEEKNRQDLQVGSKIARFKALAKGNKNESPD